MDRELAKRYGWTPDVLDNMDLREKVAFLADDVQADGSPLRVFQSLAEAQQYQMRRQAEL